MNYDFYVILALYMAYFFFNVIFFKANIDFKISLLGKLIDEV